jgi:hypothetical protein
MPIREYYEGKLVDFTWDWLDAVGAVSGAAVGGFAGSRIDGLPYIGGLAVLGSTLGVGLSTFIEIAAKILLWKLRLNRR